MPKGRMSLKDTDHGFKRLVDQATKSIGRAHVLVGVLGEEQAAGEEIGVAELATIHEFGAPSAGIPERPFLRGTFDAKREEWTSYAKKLADQIYLGRMEVEQALGLLGAKAAADVKATITTGDGVQPANTPEVFLRKLLKGTRGFNRTGAAPRTLVDTGRLVNSVTWRVDLGGGDSGED